MLTIAFHVEHPVKFDLEVTHSWLINCAKSLGFHEGEINYIFLSREEHRALNVESLGHDYDTDILTFDYRDSIKDDIISDIYINPEVVIEQASYYKEPPERELKRVLIHGLLHLSGMDDQTETQKVAMRSEENRFLNS